MSSRPHAVIGYRRVSKVEQASEWKTSLDDQTRAVCELARSLGRELREDAIYEDRFSGETAVDRPGFMAMVEYCGAHPRPSDDPGYVLFLNDSRFGRFANPDEAAHWRFRFAQQGWIVRFAQNDQTEDPTARHLIRAIGGAQASEYLRNLKANAKQGARNTAAQGFWQNEAPFGYRRLALAPGREPVVLEVGQRKSMDQKVRLTPDPGGEDEIVRWAFQTYADGLISLGDLARELRRKAPRLRWSKGVLWAFLRRRTYLGEVTWCRRPHDKEERKRHLIRPPSEWVTVENAHPALISVELFERVQERLRKNRKQTRATRGGYPLSGLLRCTHCGYGYIGGGGNRGPDDDPDRYRFYRCSGITNQRTACRGRHGTISKRIVEPLVIGEIAAVVSDPQVQAVVRDEIDRFLESAYGDVGADRTRAEQRKAEFVRQRKNLVDAIAGGVLDRDEAGAKMEEVRQGIAAADAEIQRLGAVRRAADEVRRERDRMIGRAADFAARAKELKGPALKALIEPWIESATFDKETRVLDLTIRRVPRTPGSGRAAAGPAGCGVRRVFEVPRTSQDSRSGRWKRVAVRRREVPSN